jgi:hypothetical protein
MSPGTARDDAGERRVTGSYAVPTLFDVGIIDTLEECRAFRQADFRSTFLASGRATIVGRPTFNHKRAAKSSELTKSAPRSGRSRCARKKEPSFSTPTTASGHEPAGAWRHLLSPHAESMMGALTVDSCSGRTDNFNGITGLMKVTDAKLCMCCRRKNGFATSPIRTVNISEAVVRLRGAREVVRRAELFGVLAGIDCTGKAPLVRYETASGLCSKRVRELRDMPGVQQSVKDTPFLASATCSPISSA